MTNDEQVKIDWAGNINKMIASLQLALACGSEANGFVPVNLTKTQIAMLLVLLGAAIA